MTRAQTKSLLESGVLQAYAEGKTIQLRDTGETGLSWTDWNEHEEGELLFNSNAKAYRVKPEPRHFWINIYDDAERTCAFTYKSRYAADAGSAPAKRKECIEVVEVIT